MNKLTTEDRDELRTLLEDHALLLQALDDLADTECLASINTTGKDDSHYTDVHLERGIAKKALRDQLQWVVGELSTLGIEVEIEDVADNDNAA